MISRKPKIHEEPMKTVILTPNSSSKSTNAVESSITSESRDSYYFPGCRKDANCNCQICIESMNATLDLMPQSINRCSIKKLSPSRTMIPRSPVSFNPSLTDVSTPKYSARIRPVPVSPPLNSTARVNFQEKMKRRKMELGYGIFMIRFFLGLILVFAMEYGLSMMVSGVLKPDLSPDIVKNLSEKLSVFEGLDERLLFLNNELQALVGEKVSSCSSADSVWKISQDGLLLNSKCVLYKSMTEEVSIWGWPLQTAGLLTAEYSSRSFSIVSGRVTEWLHGEVKYSDRKVNSSWAIGKWSASAVQFDPNTWILEYRQSFLMENARLISAAVDFLKFRLIQEFEKMKQELWLPSAFGSQYSDFKGGQIQVPT